jgi:hypothetical protein
LIYLVADNAAVNTCLADLLGIPMIGCASHRFNLACNKYLESSEVVLQKIESLMTTLRLAYSELVKYPLATLERKTSRKA